MKARQFCYSYRKRFSRVHLRVPLHSTNIGQKPIGLFYIAKVVIIQTMGVPFYKDPAKVENNVIDYFTGHSY